MNTILLFKLSLNDVNFGFKSFAPKTEENKSDLKTHCNSFKKYFLCI